MTRYQGMYSWEEGRTDPGSTGASLRGIRCSNIGCNESSPSDASPALQVVFRGATTRQPDSTRNVFANGVELIQNTLTPGVGEEPGFALVVSNGGRVSQ